MALTHKIKQGAEWFPFGNKSLQVVNSGKDKSGSVELTKEFISLAQSRGDEYFNEYFEEVKKEEKPKPNKNK